MVDNGRLPVVFGAVLIDAQSEIPLEEVSGAWAWWNDHQLLGIVVRDVCEAWPNSRRS